MALSTDARSPVTSFSSSAMQPVVARQSEAPNPMVMERFSAVISQLFSQVCVEKRRCAELRSTDDGPVSAKNGRLGLNTN